MSQFLESLLAPIPWWLWFAGAIVLWAIGLLIAARDDSNSTATPDDRLNWRWFGFSFTGWGSRLVLLGTFCALYAITRAR
jgi:hypothetical protein